MAHNSNLQHLSVEDRNAFILGHFVDTWQGRLSDKTLYQHVLNIQYFTNSYLSWVHDEPRSVDQVTAYNVYSSPFAYFGNLFEDLEV